MRTGIALFFFYKVSLMKHPSEHFQFQRILIKHWRTNKQITIKKTASGKVKVIKHLKQNALISNFHFLDWFLWPAIIRGMSSHWIKASPKNRLLLPSSVRFVKIKNSQKQPPSTTPPTPQAPPAGLFASLSAPSSRSLASGGTSSLVTNKKSHPIDSYSNLIFLPRRPHLRL